MILRDRAWLDKLRSYPCVISHATAHDSMGIDPAHVGVAGTGIKNHDCFCVPLRHDLHALQHQKGWRQVLQRSTWQEQLEWLKAYAFTLYLTETDKKLEDVVSILRRK